MENISVTLHSSIRGAAIELEVGSILDDNHVPTSSAVPQSGYVVLKVGQYRPSAVNDPI